MKPSIKNIKRIGLFSLTTLCATGSLLAQSSYDASAHASAGGGIGGIIWLLIMIVSIAGLWKVFTKAGQPGWASIIPIYNIYILLKIVGKPWWWLLLMLIPIVNFIIWIVVALELAKCFGKSGGFAVGLILLSFIFIPILGFGSATYKGASAA